MISPQVDVMVNAIEKRNGQPAVPDNIAIYLTVKQERALLKLCSHGWQLLFIRRPLFREARPVLVNQRRHLFGVVGSDGHIINHAHVELRD